MLLKLCRVLARSDIFFYLILWLMVLLVAGTIAEQQQGLYYAQQSYFSVYFFYLFGFIPLPGTYTILTFIFFSLLSKLILDKWRMQNLGSLITHISGLLLLLGGFFTAHFSQEGYMDIPQNQSINYISDYYATELVITNQTKPANPSPLIVKQNQFDPSKKYLNNIKILSLCKHCQLDQNKQLIVLPKPKDNEQATPILELAINNNPNINKIYLPVESNSNFTIDKIDYNFEFRHQRTYLPFSLQLNKFKEELHPGTNIAKEYSSDVAVRFDQKTIWQGLISMNNPLRYKGYTFYQSSFYTKDNQYITVLAAVYNVGQSFPYIASIILSLALLVHLFQRLPKLIKPK